MKLEVGRNYTFIYDNGSKISGELTDIKMFGTEIYSLWIDIGRQPVYIAYRDLRDVIENGSDENELNN